MRLNSLTASPDSKSHLSSLNHKIKRTKTNNEFLGLKSFGKWYIEKLDTDPIKTKSLTSAALNFFGDTVAQFFENLHAGASSFADNFNPRRALNFASMGLFYIGPLEHYTSTRLYPWIATIGGTTFGTLKKVLFDQTIGCTVFHAGFYPIYNTLVGNGFQYGLQELKAKFVTTLVMD